MVINIFRKFALLLAAITCSYLLNAQEGIKFNSITVNDGLANNIVNSVLRDSKGFIWISTENGLSRYNGYTFENFYAEENDSLSLSSNITLTVYEDKLNRVWVGSEKGLDLFNRHSGIFDKHFLQGLPIRAVYHDSKNRLWIGGDPGVFLYNEEKAIFEKTFSEISDFITSQPDLYNTICSITEDHEGNLWMAVSSGGVFIYNFTTKKITHYLHHPKKKGSLSSNNTRCIIRGMQNRMWISTYGGGVNLFQPETKTFKVFTDEGKPEGISNALTNVLWEDVDGKIWIGTDGTGIDILDPDTEKVYHVLHSPYNLQSLTNNVVRSISSDNRGGIWVGTFSGGVNFFTRNTEAFLHYKLLTFNGNSSVTSFAEEKNGNLWIGTDGGGLCYFNRNTDQIENLYHNKKNKNSLSDNRVLAVLLDHENTVWIGTYLGGLCKFNPRTRRFKHYTAGDKSGINDNIVWVLLQDSKKRLWVGTENGLNLFTPATETFRNYTIKNSTLKNNKIRALLEDSEHRLWIGTQNGLHLYDENKESFIELAGLNDSEIQTLSEDSKGNLVVGTIQGGINIVSIKKNTVRSYKQKDGMPVNMITGILPDNNHNIWISTAKGMAMLSDTAKTIKKYFVDEGIDNQFNVNAAYKTAKGEFLFGSTNGFRLFIPEVIINVEQNIYPPPVVITSFKISNKEVIPNEKGSPLHKHIHETNQITLSYDQSVLTFEFAALNFIQPQKNKYGYRLVGFEENWNYIESNIKNDIKNKRSCTYTNLEPGHYTLQLKASNNDALWSQEPFEFNITITPPFWKTQWFTIVVAVIFVASITIIINTVRRRIKRKMKVNNIIADLKMKALMAQMNPHFIFNSLTSIQELIIVNKHDEGMHYLEQFSRLLRVVLQSSDKSFISLNLEITLLDLYLELESMRFSKLFYYAINIDPSIDTDEITIPAFLVQPFVENAVWHGLMQKKGERSVTINFTAEDEVLRCTIQDNGIGRNAASKINKKRDKTYQSMGLKITRERIELLKRQNNIYNLTIQDDVDEKGDALGTTVRITMPLWLNKDGHEAEPLKKDEIIQ
jgi:ligand-binding sensor domain-containing protein/predicted acetyltransferase